MNSPRAPTAGIVRARHRGQAGAVLAIGLVLLAVLTVLAVAGMQAAILELQMAGNEQLRQRAFESAETGIEQAMSATGYRLDAVATAGMYQDPTALEPIPIAGHGTPIAGCTDAAGEPVAHCEFFVRFDQAAGAALLPGMNPDAGQRAYHFVVDSFGAAGRGARSEHTQVFYVTGPAAALQDCQAGLGGCTLTPAMRPRRTTWRQRGAD